MSELNLLNFTENELKKYITDQGLKSFHGTQIFKWIHKMGVDTFDAMTDVSLKLRQLLTSNCVIKSPEIVKEHISDDGSIKWLLKLSCNNLIETVFIPEVSRATLCVSSQAGCALNCRFCSTATVGYSRNLSVAEIVGQLWRARRRLNELGIGHHKTITNVVFMGMGEPLLNFDPVISASSIFMEDNAYGLSKYKVTVSTSGIVPRMLQLSQMSSVALTVSLHAANDVLRDHLVPINQKYPLKELMTVCKNYFPKPSKRKITFAYVMLKDVNDRDKDAFELSKLLGAMPCKVNLIPFNVFPGTTYESSSLARIQQFQDILVRKGLQTTIRKTRGEDVQAACGQLVGEVKGRVRSIAVVNK